MTTECPSCDDAVNNFHAHWQTNGCEKPPLSDRQHEILTILAEIPAGSFTDPRDGVNPCFTKLSRKPTFIRWLHEEFGPLARDRYRSDNGHYLVKQLFKFQTRAHPDIEEFIDYEPSGLDLTPFRKAVIVGGSGGFQFRTSSPILYIGGRSEVGSKLINAFQDDGYAPRHGDNYSGFYFGAEETEALCAEIAQYRGDIWDFDVRDWPDIDYYRDRFNGIEVRFPEECLGCQDVFTPGGWGDETGTVYCQRCGVPYSVTPTGAEKWHGVPDCTLTDEGVYTVQQFHEETGRRAPIADPSPSPSDVEAFSDFLDDFEEL